MRGLRPFLFLLLVFFAFTAVAASMGPIGSAEFRLLHTAGGNTRSLIIFIHGINGDNQATWKNSAARKSWPEMIAADSSMSADTLAISYLSTALGRSSNIEEVANRVAVQLVNHRIFEGYDQIAIIAHSMGGLIAKRVVRIVERDNPNFLPKIKAILFFATPAQGSNLATVSGPFSNNPQLSDMLPSDGHSFLQTLDNDWQALLRSRTTERPFPKVFCAYETLPTFEIMVVPRSDSQQACDSAPLGLDFNHVDIVKPDSESSEIYVFAAASIERAFDPKLEKQRILLKILRSDGSEVGDTGYLRSGENYSISLNAEKPAWYYVFVKDSSDIVQRYYPRKTHPQTTVLKNLRVPDDGGSELTLDQVAGTETIFVFAVATPNLDLEEAADEIGDGIPTVEASVKSAMLLDKELSKRGDILTGSTMSKQKHSVPAYLMDATLIRKLEHRQ